MKTYLLRTSLCLLLCALVGGLAAARTIEFETTQVTGADVEGLFRIEVDPAAVPHSWRGFRKLSGCTARMAKALHRTAVREGSDPKKWRVSFEPIPIDHWLDIEGWVPAEGCWRRLAEGD